jgi:2-methylisocitrate lyase-like PEP mutase family enzyme
MPETVRRARRYLEAGADGIFVPAAKDPGALAREIAAPLNVLATPGMTLRRLGALGVRRVSTGSLLYRAAFRAAIDAVHAVREGEALPPATPYADLQQLMR